MNIKFKAEKASGAGQYYAALVLSDIKEDDGGKIKVKTYLEVSLLSPVPIKDVKTEIQFDKWDQEFNIVIKNCDEISKNEYQVDFVISTINKQPFTIDSGNKIELRLSSPSGEPDLRGDLSKYIKSVLITADKHPAIDGSVKIICETAPDVKLKEKSVALDFIIGTTKKPILVKVGDTHEKKLLAGSYSITPHELVSEDRNVVVPVQVTPKKINIEVDKTSEVKISFGTIKRYSSLKFSISNIPELATETFFVTLQSDNGYHYNFETRLDRVSNIYELPATGKLNITVNKINLNNKAYEFNVEPVNLTNNNVEVKIKKDNIKVKEETHNIAGKVSISLESDKDLTGKFIEVRLISENHSYNQFFEIKNKNEHDFSVEVKSGKYKVIAGNFIDKKIVHVVETLPEIEVKNGDNKLKVTIKASANLVVRGFDPDTLTFGGCATLEPDNDTFFIKAKARSIFKYAGSGGNGDPDKILVEDFATKNTIALARKIEKVFKESENNVVHKVLPVMISYTVQLSGGDDAALQSQEKLKNSFANFILTLSVIMKSKDDAHSVPAGIIVNPDMLGNCLQHKLPANHAMPVKGPLQEALKARKVLIETIPGVSALPAVPSGITEDIKGYIQAVNWLVSVLAPAVTFGWQINLWGIDGGGSQWVYGAKMTDKVASFTAKEAAKKIADFVRDMGVYTGKHVPDFLAIDRYEADDLTPRSFGNSYCYGPQQWAVYFDFCAAISAELKLPVMPWQIPASRTPLLKDEVNVKFEDQHWGTAANYILGDPELGSNVDNIHPTVRNFSFSKHNAAAIAQLVGDTPGAMYQQGGAFDVSRPAYRDFPLRGIFHVEFGGGSTVGMVPPTGGRKADLNWGNQKLAEYAEHPVEFKDSLKKK